jgi:hypothetical protein
VFLFLGARAYRDGMAARHLPLCPLAPLGLALILAGSWQRAAAS